MSWGPLSTSRPSSVNGLLACCIRTECAELFIPAVAKLAYHVCNGAWNVCRWDVCWSRGKHFQFSGFSFSDLTGLLLTWPSKCGFLKLSLLFWQLTVKQHPTNHFKYEPWATREYSAELNTSTVSALTAWWVPDISHLQIVNFLTALSLLHNYMW